MKMAPLVHQPARNQWNRRAEELREHPEMAHIPVIALSANAIPRDIEKGMAAGLFRYVTKPIKIDEFMRTLDSALEFAAHAELQ
jgi:CheY-like chemotaxis protein